MTQIHGKVALVTGASGGLGYRLCHRLAEQGAQIIALARNELALQTLVKEIRDSGGSAAFISADLTDLPSLAKVVEKANSIFGPIDLLVNNAGKVNFFPQEEYSLSEVQALFNLNIISCIELTRLLLPSMRERKSGHIVNMSSLSGKIGSPYGNIYVASKAALNIWTHALRQELQGTGIVTSLICPSYIAEAGSVEKLRIKLPRSVLKNHPEVVVSQVLTAVRENRAETIVYPGPLPIKLLMALTQVFPTLPDPLLRFFGILKAHRDCALRQAQERKQN